MAHGFHKKDTDFIDFFNKQVFKYLKTEKSVSNPCAI
ncbi:MAG: hypothetical protein RIR11_1947 [Bacteroidota bacterium]|jgi:hypothetical protein